MHIHSTLKLLNSTFNEALWIYKYIDDPGFVIQKSKWTGKNIVIRYIKSFFILVKHFFSYFRKEIDSPEYLKDCNILLYVNSQNTRNTLNPLKKINNSIIFTQNSSVKVSKTEDEVVHNFRFTPILLVVSLINFPFFGLFYWKKIFKYPDLYFENWGKYHSNKRLINNYPNIKKIVFANDHNFHNKLFLLAAKHCGVNTVYLQHASVTEKFPPLEFDINLLMGQIDYEKYTNIGVVNGKSHLIGSPMFDDIFVIRRTSMQKTNSIGIAYNILDELEKISELIKVILTSTNYNIFIRPHPRDTRDFIFPHERVNLLKPNTQTLTTFLNSIDILIAGDSSIHLEAVYSNRKSYIFPFKNEIFDSYGFLLNGIVDFITLDDIRNHHFITEVPDDFYKIAQNYIGSIGTSFDGKVADQVIQIISKFSDED